jgi:CHASE3 domain sensor protein
VQNKLLPVFIVAAIVQMAVLAGAIFSAQKLADANAAIVRSQMIQYRAASMERSVLSANMSSSNFVKALSSEDTSAAPSASADEAYRKGTEELQQLEQLVTGDPYYKEQIERLTKLLNVTRKVADSIKDQMVQGKSEGMGGMLKVVPSVQGLYKVVDKMNSRINDMLQHEQDRAQQLTQDRDQSQQMLTVLLFGALVLSLGGTALIPAMMKR